jgi:probable F420-dependent oxidoreductase
MQQLGQHTMRIGVTFPQTEIGSDPIVIRDYAQAVEDLGYTHLLAFDHVLGAHPDRFPGWKPPYTHESPFHEVCVLFGYLAGLTRSLELVLGVLVLPQRQTALVAKQTAEIQLLSGGRLRLGVGVGWNFVEYEALGANFHDRGRRVEEQIEVLRRLWTEDLVHFEGKYHTIRQASINPRPQHPIPVWFGGMADAVLRRVARLGAGWLPQFQPGPEAAALLARLHEYVRAAGRRPEDIGLEGRLSIATVPEDRWTAAVQAWRDLGATHLAVNTMGAGLASPDAHLAALRRFAQAVGVR